jgi:LysM repeat protein
MISMRGLREKPLTLLIGKIVASNGSTIPDDIQIYVTDNATKQEIGVFKPRSRDHKFTIIIPPGSDYHLSYETGDTAFYEDDIYVPEEASYQEIEKAIDLKPINFDKAQKGMNPKEEIPAPEKKPAPKVDEAQKPVEEPKAVVTETPTPKVVKEIPVVQAPVTEAPAPVKTVTATAPVARPAYKTEVENVDGKKYIIHRVEKGNTLFTISVLYNTKLSAIREANPWAGDLIYEGDKIQVPIPANAKFYQEFFAYNETTIHTDAQDFKNFVEQVASIIKQQNKATIAIESSASKVPTAKFGDNENLTLKRGEIAKETLTSVLRSQGIDTGKLLFASMSTLVRGPAYQNDAGTNKEEYKNYQYVKIIVK